MSAIDFRAKPFAVAADVRFPPKMIRSATGPNRTFEQPTANGGIEPTLYVYCDVANVLFADEGKKLSLTLEALKYG